jgi:capsular exopolysaccharide synthesis family protein
MNENGSINPGVINQENSLENIDWNKFRSVFRRNILWVILILISTNLIAYLYIRYTKPLFESYSDLKLEVKSEATSLGLTRFPETSNRNNISGEIELINSRLFFNKVIEAVAVDVQYFTRGDILDDEKYKHSPFTVAYELYDGLYYNTPFDLSLISDQEFNLSIGSIDENPARNYSFGDTIKTNSFKMVLNKTQYFNEDLLDEQFYFIINSHETLVKYLEDNITVEPLNLNANSIRITFQDYNKYKAHDLVNAIDTLYLNYTNQEKNLANANKIVYLDEQLKDIEQTLEDFESYFENFTIDNKTVDLDADVKSTLRYMNSLDSQRFELRSRIEHVEGISEQIITENLDDINIKRNIIPAHLVSEIEELDKLVFEYKQLGLSYKENTFAFERKTQELDLVRGNLVTGLNQYKLNLYERLTEVNKKKKELENQLTSLPSKGTEFNKAKRYYALYEEMYLSLMQSRNEFEIARAGTIPDFKILSSASLPNTPISPNTLLVHGTGAISGFILSFLFLGFSYLVNTKIASVQEVESLTSAPILGSLPYHNAVRDELGIFVVDKPKSAPSEAFRSIRTNIEFILPDIKKRVISVSSTVSGEGKTFVSLNLGGVIAMSDQKVVVLDLDLRKPRIHKYLESKHVEKGISTLLIKKHGLKECIEHTEVENLDFIPSGPIPPNPSELLLNEFFSTILEELKQSYDVIILDTPPIGLVTDAVMVMRNTDLKIFVVRADYSLRSYIKAVNRLINVNKFKNVGVVVNALKGSGSYGYGYGYGYGSKYYEEQDNGSWFSTVRRKFKI